LLVEIFAKLKIKKVEIRVISKVMKDVSTLKGGKTFQRGKNLYISS